MPLNRVQNARNCNTKKRNLGTKEILKKTKELETICDKHRVGNLTFKSCKLATSGGKVTSVEFNVIKGNMRSGITLVIAKKLFESEYPYDLVQIAKDKMERDKITHEDEIDKVKLEMDRIQNNKDALNVSNEQENLLLKMVDEDNKKLDEIYCEHIGQKETENSETDKPNKDNSNISPDQPKMDDRLDKSKEAPKEKRNKYYRNFMKEIKEKFKLEQLNEYKYLEMRVDSTDMVIDGTIVYKIIMPEKVNETYLLVVGDLQMKTGLIKQIDPSYRNDKVIEEHDEFLERIKAKENARINELSEEISDEDDIPPLEPLDKIEPTEPLEQNDDNKN